MENGGDQRSLAKCRVCEEYVNIECDKCNIQTAEEKKTYQNLKRNKNQIRTFETKHSRIGERFGVFRSTAFPVC